MRDELWGALFLTILTYLGFAISKAIWAVLELMWK